VSRSTRKSFVTSKERIILHLLNFHKFRQDSTAPEEVTQEGMAHSIQVGRNNVSKLVNELASDGLVDVQTKHVRGFQRVRKVYFLTHIGLQYALSLKEEIEGEVITLLDFDGQQRRETVGRINLHLPRSYPLVELIAGIEGGVFHCSSFHDKKVKEERRYVDYTDRKPAVRVFFGREKELKRLYAFLERNGSGLLSVIGIAGIGKTTLLAKFAQEVRERTHIFWYKIHEWVSPKILLAPLAEFLSQIGHKGLERYLGQTEAPKPGEVLAILELDLKEVSALIIIDDVQKALPPVQELLQALVNILDQLPEIRVICASREVPTFYSRSQVVSGLVEELYLNGLDRESAEMMLSRRALSSDVIDSIITATEGHPLFLQLIEDPQSVLGHNVRMFIEQEVYARLGLAERRMLEIASIFRYPILVDAFFVMEEEIEREIGRSVEEMSYQDYMVDYDTLDGLLSKSLLNESVGRMIGMHDLIREFFYSRLTPRQRQTYHKAAVRYYLEDGSALSFVEALYHSIMAEEWETAVSIAVGHGHQIISRGYAEPFEPLLRHLIDHEDGMSKEDRIGLLFLLGHIKDIQGEWDSAIDRLNEALSVVTDSTDLRIVAQANRRIGSILLRRAAFNDAILYLRRSLEISEKAMDTHTLVEVLYDLGGMSERMGRCEEAINYFIRSEDLAKSIGDDVGLGKALYGIGRSYAQLKDYTSAIGYKKEALEALKRTGNTDEIAKVNTSLGIDLKESGDVEEGLECEMKAIELARSSGNLTTLGYAFSNAAAFHIELGNLEEGENLVEQATKIFEKLQDRIVISTLHLYRGFIYSKRNEWPWAKEEFSKGLSILRTLEVPLKLSNWLYEIAQVYLEHDDVEEAVKLFWEALEIASRTGHENLRKEVEEAIASIGI